jgi:signal transduction histidine kinase
LANARLHEQQVLLAQQEERRRITYEVHDGIAQLVVGAKQRLDTCRNFGKPMNRAPSGNSRTVSSI